MKMWAMPDAVSGTALTLMKWMTPEASRPARAASPAGLPSSSRTRITAGAFAVANGMAMVTRAWFIREDQSP